MKIKHISFALLCAGLTLVSCGGDEKSDDKKDDKETTESASNEDSEESEGEIVEEAAVNAITKSWSYNSKRDEDGNYGFIDKNDNWVIEPQFHGANFRFQHDRGAVKNEDWLYGYCDINGELVIPYKYKSAGDFSMDGTAAVKTDENKWLIIDKNGETILDLGDKYTQVGGFWEGMASVINEAGACGFIDKSGKEIIPLKYEPVTLYLEEDGKGTYFSKENNVGTFAHKATGKKGLLNKEGKELCEFKYDYMPVYAKDNGTIVVKIGDKFGALSDKGEEILPCEYDKVMVTNLSSTIKTVKDGEEKEFNFDGSPA